MAEAIHRRLAQAHADLDHVGSRGIAATRNFLRAFERLSKSPDVLKRDEIGLNRHRALALCSSMIFSENRFTLFRIML
jgi:hypothetical protein